MVRLGRPSWSRCLAGIAVVAATAGRAEATPIFNPGNGHYYDLTTGLDNWLQAEAEAVSLGGHLVSITSQAEQNFVVGAFLSGANDRSLYWIGLTDQALEGTFVWTNGDPFSYSFWEAGEPNDCPQCNFIPPGEDYVGINWHYGLSFPGAAKGSWNDTTVTSSEFGPQPFGITQGIIEFNTDPTAVPEPGSLMLLGGGLALLWRRNRTR